MTLIVQEIQAKTILSPSKIYPYVINPYTGCQHGCSYCYARFMKRVTGHREPWGEFVDVKINAPDLLRGEIKKKKRKRRGIPNRIHTILMTAKLSVCTTIPE